MYDHTNKSRNMIFPEKAEEKRAATNPIHTVNNSLAPVEYEIQKKKGEQKLLHMSNLVLRSALPVVNGVEIEDLNSEGWAWPLFLLYIFGFSVVFLYYTIMGTKSLLANQFLSLKNIKTSAVCKEIPLAITGTFSADLNGVWETDALRFQKNSSIFILDFVGTPVGNDEYADAIAFFATEMEKLGQKASTRSVVWSLLAWTTFHFTHQGSNLVFYSNADVDSMFQGSAFYCNLWTNREGICHPSMDNEVEANSTSRSQGYYDVTTNSLVLKIPEEWSAPCPNQGGNSMMDFVLPRTIDHTWTFSFDIRTIQTAVALNMGIISTSDLLKVYPVYYDFIDGYAPGAFFIDPFYTLMDPIFCIDKNDHTYGLSKEIISGPEVCFLAAPSHYYGVFGLKFGYPIINQETSVDLDRENAGIGWTGFMKQCTCPHNANDPNCNSQDFFYSIIYADFNNSAGTDGYWKDILAVGLRFQKFLVDDPKNGDIAMMEFFSPVAVYAAMEGYGFSADMNYTSYFDNYSQLFYNYSWNDGLSLDGLLQQAWDKICPERTCGAFVFEAGKQYNSLFLQLNSEMVQLGRFGSTTYFDSLTNRTLPRMMCMDTLSQTASFEKLKKKTTCQVDPTIL